MILKINSIQEHIRTAELIAEDKTLLNCIADAAEAIAVSFHRGGKLLLCGNGGSAADAQHIAAEFVGRFLKERVGLDAEALTTNTSIVTAIGNDYGFDSLFARQVEAKGRKGDVLIAISTSGASRNVLEAIASARVKSLVTISLTGGGVGTPIRQAVDYCIAVPSLSTPRIQEAHSLIGHMICDYVESKLFP